MRRLRQGASPSRDCRQDHLLQAFEEERPNVLRGRFDGFHAVSVAVSKTCLVPLRQQQQLGEGERGRGRPVELHAYAIRVVIRQDGIVVGDNMALYRWPRRDGLRPRHYVPVLARKPVACGTARRSRTGSSAAMEKSGRKLTVRRGRPANGENPRAVSMTVLPAVEAACAEAVDQGVHSADEPFSTSSHGAAIRGRR